MAGDRQRRLEGRGRPVGSTCQVPARQQGPGGDRPDQWQLALDSEVGALASAVAGQLLGAGDVAAAPEPGPQQRVERTREMRGPAGAAGMASSTYSWARSSAPTCQQIIAAVGSAMVSCGVPGARHSSIARAGVLGGLGITALGEQAAQPHQRGHLCRARTLTMAMRLARMWPLPRRGGRCRRAARRGRPARVRRTSRRRRSGGPRRARRGIACPLSPDQYSR